MTDSLYAGFSYYDPTPWYLRYDNLKSSEYYDYFVFNKLFNSARLPIPAFWEIKHIVYLQYWSALLESPWIKASLLFMTANTMFTILATIFFFESWLKGEGFEGWDFNTYAKNKDSVVAGVNF